MFRMKTLMAALFALALSIGLTTTAPVHAQDNDTALVNVEIGDITTGDILSNNRVSLGVAAEIAANVCGQQVQVGVLALQLQDQDGFRCENRQTLKFVQITK